MWDKLFSSVDLLQKGLEASWARNAVLRNNLANSETPGFKSSDVRFETIFASAIENGGFHGKTTRDKHLPLGNGHLENIGYQIIENKDTAMLFNENNVDPEAENVKLAQNSIFYNTVLTKLNGDLTRIKLAITEGR